MDVSRGPPLQTGILGETIFSIRAVLKWFLNKDATNRHIVGNMESNSKIVFRAKWNWIIQCTRRSMNVYADSIELVQSYFKLFLWFNVMVAVCQYGRASLVIRFILKRGQSPTRNVSTIKKAVVYEYLQIRLIWGPASVAEVLWSWCSYLQLYHKTTQDHIW